jgi:hypothetical protein
MFVEFGIMLIKSGLVAAVAAWVTALCTGPGPSGFSCARRLVAAYPAWLAAMAVLFFSYFYAWTQGQPPSSVSTLLFVAVFGLGGWAALFLVRSARARSKS